MCRHSTHLCMTTSEVWTTLQWLQVYVREYNQTKIVYEFHTNRVNMFNILWPTLHERHYLHFSVHTPYQAAKNIVWHLTVRPEYMTAVDLVDLVEAEHMLQLQMELNG